MLILVCPSLSAHSDLFFFFNYTSTTEIYTDLHTRSLPDALPIFRRPAADRSERFARHIGTLARVGTERLVEEAAEHAADDRGYPEQPQLLQRPTACDQRRDGAARRIDRRVGHRDADKMDQRDRMTVV